ncbi:hypothetical protein P7C70_g6586, partial [Phenoliferia sp. Uapishka_3]
MMAELSFEIIRKRQPRRSARANPPPYPQEIVSDRQNNFQSEIPDLCVASGRPSTTGRGSERNPSCSLQHLIPTQPAPFLIPTPPASTSNLSPEAPPFVPSSKKGSKPPKPPPEEYPFLFLFASLLQLASLVQLTPTRWGSALVAMLSKLKAGDKSSPTASQLRPISLLKMFRRIFEFLLIPFLTSTTPGHWAFLHPNQAGFRKGWSCASALLAVDHHVRHDYPWAVHLDFKAAYPSPLPVTVIEQLKKKGMPPSLLSITWSLIANSCTATLILNGRTLPTLDVKKGFPQGGATSPILFDLFLDPLLYDLEDSADAEGAAFYYADDGTLVGIDQVVVQRLLDVAYAWARRMGMLFNIPKCFVIPPSNFPLHLVILHINGELIEATRRTKYLGIIRTADGCDMFEYLTRTTTSMEKTLRLLQAVGDSWRPMIRRHVFRMVCAARIDYAAALIELWLQSKEENDHTRVRIGNAQERKAARVLVLAENTAYKALQTHHKRALGWVIKHNGKSLFKLAVGMTAIPNYPQRLPLLAFGLALHIREASQYNVSQRLLCDPNLPEEPNDLLFRLRDHPFLPVFDSDRRRHASDYPDALPLTRGAWVRTVVLRLIQMPGDDAKVLHTYIHPSSRSTSLVDRVLDIRDPGALRRAMEWRKGVFCIHRNCYRCGQRFNRGHVECML